VNVVNDELSFFDRLALVAAAVINRDQAGYPLSREKQRAVDELEAAMRQTGTEPTPDRDAIFAWIWAGILEPYVPAWDRLTDEQRAVELARAELRLRSDTSTLRDAWVEATAATEAAADWGVEALTSWVAGTMTPRVEAIISNGIIDAYAEQAAAKVMLERVLTGEAWICGACGAHIVARFVARPESGLCARCGHETPAAP
jgi:hypothetical protein